MRNEGKVTLAVTAVRPGPKAFEWLREHISAAKQGDSLAPVTVIVPNHYVGLWLRRELAQSGYANVHFEILARLAERLGARSLAEDRRTPLRPAVDDAVIHMAIREAGERFGDVASNPALVDTLRHLFHSLREHEATDEQLSTWRRAGRTAGAALTAFMTYERVLGEEQLYDDRAALDAASLAVASADLREVGVVLVYLPTRLTAAAARFVRALSSRSDVHVALASTGDEVADDEARSTARSLGSEPPSIHSAEGPKARVFLAPTVDDEIRAVVRKVLVDLATGVPLHRVAILYRAHEPYAQLVRETLAAAGLPWAGLEGRPLSDSVVAQGLLALLGLPGRGFGRVDVLEWRSTLPHAGRDDVSFAEWNRLTREAGVVRGADQWHDRLTRFAEELRRSAEHAESDAARQHLERRAGRATRIGSLIAEVVVASEPPAEQTWTAYVAWAKTLRRRFVPSHPEPDEQDAANLIDGAIDSLAAAAPLGTATNLSAFEHALDSVLRGQRRPQGRIGVGVIVGNVAVARGLVFERLYLVGMTDGLFPPRRPPDPIFLDDDPLGERVSWLADERSSFLTALAGVDGGSATCSAPMWDADMRPTYASAWLMAVAQLSAGRSMTAAELRTGRAQGWERIASPADAIARMSEPIDLAERRVSEASGWYGRGALERSAVAQRTDLPLGRALELQIRRRARDLSVFDGNLAETAASTPRLRDGLARGLLSASAIERWCTCPFHYFLERVLYVEATAQPEDDEAWTILPAVRGALIHDVLDRFMHELLAMGRPGNSEIYTREDHERLDLIATDAFRELEVRGMTGYRLAWENERRAILRDLHIFLVKDEQYRRERGMLPAYFEQGFGMRGDGSWPEIVIPLADGSSVRLRGAIDRIDVAPDREHPTRASVTDYKTGSVQTRELRDDPLRAGKSAQLGLYSLVVREHLRKLGASEPEVTAAYWQIASKHKFARTEVPTGPDLDARLREILDRVHAGIARGAFPQRPGAEEVWPERISWENCTYCEYDRVCPAARGILAERKEGDQSVAIHIGLTRP